MERIPESDWRHMRDLKPALLEVLCGRINARTAEILRTEWPSEHDRYGEVYGHVRASDRIVADCFDDWRRSNLVWKIGFLLKHDVLAPEQYAGLSEETRQFLNVIRSL